MEAEATHSETGIALSQLCSALQIPRSTVYRRRRPAASSTPRPTPPRALTPVQRQEVLDVLRSERFVDTAPAAVVAALLEEERYLCSTRTMYRILATEDEVRERRNQLRHPNYAKPELLATRPNELWSWDITKLLGPTKWTYFYLYVVLDVFSRYVVGWMIAYRESATLAGRLIEESILKHDVDPEKLTIHADRGPAMRSKHVAQLLADLGATKTHSRPYTSSDNPYSESQFKTMKYRPQFPARFDSKQQALEFSRPFFDWYNNEHRHSSIAMLAPSDVFFGRAEVLLAKRQATLQRAYGEHPERFPNGCPVVPGLPKEVWINKPADDSTEYIPTGRTEEVAQ